LDTENAGPERFRRRQPLGVGGGEIHHQADRSHLREVAAADSKASNLDQAGQLADRADETFSASCVDPDTVVAY
jgi:hypothetical protein